MGHWKILYINISCSVRKRRNRMGKSNIWRDFPKTDEKASSHRHKKPYESYDGQIQVNYGQAEHNKTEGPKKNIKW